MIYPTAEAAFSESGGEASPDAARVILGGVVPQIRQHGDQAGATCDSGAWSTLLFDGDFHLRRLVLLGDRDRVRAGHTCHCIHGLTHAQDHRLIRFIENIGRDIHRARPNAAVDRPDEPGIGSEAWALNGLYSDRP